MLKDQGYAFTVSQTNAYCVVRAEGELDIASVPQLRAAVAAARRHAGRIVIDLRDVSFLDTFALRAIVALQDEHCECPSFHVVPGEGAQRVLDLLGARAALRWISPEQLAG
jgi:anti-sigma B factor antagonist